MPFAARESGSAPRWCSPPTAQAGAPPRPSGESPPRSRWSTPTRWSTTISPAWTTTTCAGAARPPTAPSTWPPRRASGSSWCRSPRESWPTPPRSLGLSEAETAGAGRRAVSRRAESAGWSAGSGSTWRPRVGTLDLDELTAVHRGKTGALIRAVVRARRHGGRRPAGVVDALRRTDEEIGLAFQVADDVLDATATSAELGKTAGRDAALAKSTYVQPARGGAGAPGGGPPRGGGGATPSDAGRARSDTLGRARPVYCDSSAPEPRDPRGYHVTARDPSTAPPTSSAFPGNSSRSWRRRSAIA